MPSRAEQKRLRSLHTRKGREESGLFLAEGPRLLHELLVSGVSPVRVLYTSAAAEDPAVAGLVERLAEGGAEVEEIAERQLDRLATTVTPQGVLAVAEIPRKTWDDLRHPRLLVLDALQDPGNLGALVRTAEALGAGGIVALPGTVDPWSPKSIRGAAGSSFRIPILQETWEEAHARLRTLGVRVWAADAHGEPVGGPADAPAHLALVLGNEGAGVSAAVLAECDRRVAIALQPPVQSLNVAVAGALLMDRLFTLSAHA